MIFKSGKANAGCWSFGPVLGLCAGYLYLCIYFSDILVYRKRE